MQTCETEREWERVTFHDHAVVPWPAGFRACTADLQGLGLFVSAAGGGQRSKHGNRCVTGESGEVPRCGSRTRHLYTSDIAMDNLLDALRALHSPIFVCLYLFSLLLLADI